MKQDLIRIAATVALLFFYSTILLLVLIGGFQNVIKPTMNRTTLADVLAGHNRMVETFEELTGMKVEPANEGPAPELANKSFAEVLQMYADSLEEMERTLTRKQCSK